MLWKLIKNRKMEFFKVEKKNDKNEIKKMH